MQDFDFFEQNRPTSYWGLLIPLCFCISLLVYESLDIGGLYEISKIPEISIEDSKLSLNNKVEIEIGKEAAVELKKSISSLGNSLGFAATVSAITTAVSKVISRTSLPPILKVCIVLFAGIFGCCLHVVGNLLNNRVSESFSRSNLPNTENTSLNLSDSVNKLVYDGLCQNYLDYNSYLAYLTLVTDLIIYGCLSLVIIYSAILLFRFFNLNKYYIKSLTLNFYSLLERWYHKLSNSLIYYLINIIQFSKKNWYIYIYYILYIVYFILMYYFIMIII